MNIKRKRHFQPEVSTSSLNDIMFFLLLFFLIVSSLANPNVIKLLLPNSKSAQNLNKQQISISVTKDKRYFIDNRQISFNDIEPFLKSRMSSLQEPTVILRLEQSLTVQDLVDILEIGSRLQVKMVMATNKKTGQ
ncbi:MAG: biopolymer transporter ExbD [Bacteroidales bacterium]|jgi:biopolymer transport protein ExbD|nr:biopolymer transporter ExbD [Bacteroidales bacterium]